MKDFDLKKYLAENKLLKEGGYDSLRDEVSNVISSFDGYMELETNEMMTIPGFDVDAFRQYMNDGSGEYSEQEVQDLISQAEMMVIRKLFNK